MHIHVVKLGGSLLDLSDLPSRLDTFRQSCGEDRIALIVGGGRAADVVRAWDKSHHLSEEEGHWLAVRAMQFNTMVAATSIAAHKLVDDNAGCRAAWDASHLALIDPLAWLKREAAARIGSPKEWAFTSDSIAAHIAKRLGAAKLTLLKSTLPTDDHSIEDVVDALFMETSKEVPYIELVDLRAWPHATYVIR